MPHEIISDEPVPSWFAVSFAALVCNGTTFR